MMRKIRDFVKTRGLLCAAAFFAGVLFLYLALFSIEWTSKTSFCMKCHEMRETLGELEHSSHWINRSGYQVHCRECHITPGTAGMVKAKMNGLREVAVHFAEQPSKHQEKWRARRLELREKLAKELPQQNCTRCHDLATMVPSTKEAVKAHDTITGKMRCLDCHSVRGLTRLVHSTGEGRRK
ncbi:MAG: NapC/NirT family cytochrome c [Candidatus Eremiobacteraeota bacterium]|nr:NapC/NirT family cytochrome c [Candidatus Eremiobacteraeota bacterium]